MSNSKRLQTKKSALKLGIVNPEKNPVFIDYITFAINQINDYEIQFEWLGLWLKKAGLTISTKRATKPINYDIALLICVTENPLQFCGSIKYSEQYQRVMVELSGDGCAMLEKFDNYHWLISYTGQINIDLKRVDLAHDDYLGRFTIEAVDKAYCRGNFNSDTGVRPEKTNWGNPKDGRTRYIGARTAYKKTCIYEKGKEVGAKDRPNWMRYEVRFRSNGRDKIPKEMLLNRHQYFFSAHPKVFKRFTESAEYYPVVYRKSLEYACSIGSSLQHSRKQYGYINNEAFKLFGVDGAREILTREGHSKSTTRLPFITDEYLIRVFGDQIKNIAIDKD